MPPPTRTGDPLEVRGQLEMLYQPAAPPLLWSMKGPCTPGGQSPRRWALSKLRGGWDLCGTLDFPGLRQGWDSCAGGQGAGRRG